MAKKSNPKSFVQQIVSNNKTEQKTLNKYLSNNESSQDAVARILLTGILKNQFYRSADSLAKEAVPLFVEQAITNPEFLLKAAGFARQSHMKGMVKVALAALLGHANEEFLNKHKDDIVSILQTFHPGQLIQFVELMKSKTFGRGFGSRPQKLVARAMNTWSYTKTETYTLKYPKALNELLRLVHPKINADKSKLYSYVLTDLPNQKRDIVGVSQKITEMLKKLTQPSLVASQMLEHNIPWDVIKGFAGMGPEIAKSCLKQMGLTALLLNMRSLDEKNVFDEDGIKTLKEKLSNVRNERSLPIDFAKPYIYVQNKAVKDILLEAMRKTLDIPMPCMENKRIGVSVDISGSMRNEPIITAGLLSVPFLKAQDLWFTTFNTMTNEEGSANCPKIKGHSRTVQIRNLLNIKCVGGTAVSAAIKTATEQNRMLDLMVIITDEQQNSGTPLRKAWRDYKAKVNPEAILWVINAQNTEWHSADFQDPSIVVYQSMTPAIFNNLEYIGANLTDMISNFTFSKACSKMVEPVEEPVDVME